MVFFEIISVLSLAAWVYLLCGRGGFWRVQPVRPPKSPATGKSVAVVIPARNEEPVIGRAIASVLEQNYDAPLHVCLVDDHSTDGTVAAAGTHDRLTIIESGTLPEGWTGKVWALSEGLKHVEAAKPDYILFTDADIVHPPGSIAGLVARAEAENLDLASYMVRLNCQSFAERALIPAFVFFFFKLYPPSWVVRRDRITAGAAGGCILIRSSALARIGGTQAIRGELIDDCALARAVKRSGGGIWLGLTRDAASIREYRTPGEIHRMIARTAFTQLRYSAILLAGTLAGMAIIYLAPPLLVFTRDPLVVTCGAIAWLLMTISYLPMLRFYGRSLLWAPFLPLIALFYMIATIDSAIRYWRGRGGLWKDRINAPACKS